MIYKNFQDYRDAWAGAFTKTPPAPLNIDIELASICNLACPFCFWGESSFNDEMKQPAADGKPKKRFMPTEMAVNLIDEAASIGVPALKFNWRGESTMHPDYSDILNYARRKTVLLKEKVSKQWNPTHTNGEMYGSFIAFHELLVNTNANCKDHAIDGLMAATKVMVSLDSTIPEIYKKMRVQGDLERAKFVIEELIRRQHPNLWVRRVMTKENAEENFAQNVRQLFGKAVKVSEHACFDRNADEHHQMADPLRFERTYCGYPSQRMMIASDGSVFPCCVDYDGTMVMGKYPEQTLLEIWNGMPFKVLRAELRAGEFKSKACANCTSWMAYKSTNRELVQDREV